jgi:aminoglycoside phosphotransferase (APT) family kinase protein
LTPDRSVDYFEHLMSHPNQAEESAPADRAAASGIDVEMSHTLEPKKYLGDVGDVRETLRFDERRLDTWMSAHVEGYSGPLTVRQFDGGQSNPTYLLQARSGKYVLRRKPPGALQQSAHAVDREYRVLSALFAQDFPVPQPLALCEDTAVLGTMFYVMAYVSGRIFWDCTMPDLSRDERGALFDSVCKTLARLHSFDPVKLGLGDFGRPGNYFGRQIARWSRQYEATKSDDIPEMERLMAWLPGAVPADDGRSAVIHGDYSFHNVMIHPAESRVVAVVDWELATIGHPLGDLSYHMMDWYRPEGVDLRGTLKDKDFKSLGIPTFDEYVTGYCGYLGARFDGNFAFYRAYNLFRVAAIVQGVAHRLQSGNAASSNAQEVIARVRPLAVAAWTEAREAGAT